VNQNKVRRAAELLAGARHAVALTGAGVSTPSGIPDFRSPHSGLWNNVNPMAIASLDAFYSDPSAFYNWIASIVAPSLDAKPNAAHYALAQMESLDCLKSITTQNVDGLHQRAGSHNVWELHGHLREMTCVTCGLSMSAERPLRDLVQEHKMPRCAACGGLLKPALVLFGEQLPRDVLMAAQKDALACDVMLVVGSSLETAPACNLPDIARQAGAHLIIVDHRRTMADSQAEVLIRDDVAVALPAIVEQMMHPDQLSVGA
jgi:NAD-dependent deacetylase